MRVEDGADVLFVVPPGGLVGGFAEHLGVAFLRTMLHREGIRSRQFLPGRDVTLSTFGEWVREARPALVGLTAYESNWRACRSLARVVREAAPGAVILVGGPSATFSPGETLDLVGADACLRGAGEGAIVEIARAVLGSGQGRRALPDALADVPNLVLRADGGHRSTRVTGLSSFPADRFRRLDDVPSPYRAGMVTTADVGLLTSRGCNQACTYCSFAAISERRVHHHGVERVLDDLAVLHALGPGAGEVAIQDDAFTLSPNRARAICEGIVARGLQMPFTCMTRSDRVDAGLLGLMRRAGFVSVAFGLESAVPRVLRTIGKVQDPDVGDDPAHEREEGYLRATRDAVREALRAGLRPSVSVIGGLPGETAEDFRTTLRFVESLGVPGYAHNVLSLFPGTPLHDARSRHGLDAGRDPRTRRWWTRHAYDADAVAPLPSSSTVVELRQEARRIADALCGRVGPGGPGDDAAWAVVLHADQPEPEVVAWLRDVLAMNGLVVVVAGSPETGSAAIRERWREALEGAGIPAPAPVILVPEGQADGVEVLASVGTRGRHRFELTPEWSRSRSRIQDLGGGNCVVPIWLAGAAGGPPPAEITSPLAGAAPQIADGCRWWSSWRRCARARVLHAWPDRSVTACWSGPTIGRVGDGHAAIRARGRSLAPAPGGPDHCPMHVAAPSGTDASRAEDLDVAATFCWAYPVEVAVHEAPIPRG